MSEHEFYDLLKECREVFEKSIPSFERKGADFDSLVYADGVRNDIITVKKYLAKTSRLVADLGCGKGHISVLLRDAGYDVIGLDIPEPTGEFNNLSKRLWQIESWRKNAEKYDVSFSLADMRKLPIRNGVFDGIVMYAVIEHISHSEFEVKETIREVWRTVKNGGYLFIFRCPRRQSYAEKLASILGFPRHDKLYEENELKKLLSANFTILEFRRTDMILAFVPCLRLWNRLSPFLLILDKILLKTPLSLFSHHMLAVCKKDSEK